MALQLTLLNLALAHHGEDPTDTLDLNVMATNPRKVFRFMERARDQVVGSHHWSWATEFSVWNPATEGGNWRFQSCYLQPADCLRVVEVDSGAMCGGPHWQRGTWTNPDNAADQKAAIFADSAGPLNVAWVRRIGWDALPPDIEDTFGYWLASMAGFSINGDLAKADVLMKRAVSARSLAMGADGVQSGGGPPLLESGFAALRVSAG